MAARASETWVLVCLGALLARWVAAGKGHDLEGKVEFCQATVVKGDPGTKFPTTPPGPVVAAAVAAKPPRVGLEFPARSSALFAERNFPGHSTREGKLSPLCWSGQPVRLQGPAERERENLGKLKMGIL